MTMLTYSKKVPQAWIDVNGHMNAMHYYQVIYDAHVAMTDSIGLGEDYVKSTHFGKAVLESHMVFEAEISEGDQLEVMSTLLAVDQKRLHFSHELYNRTLSKRAAFSEQVDIHMDLHKRCSAALPSYLQASLKGLVDEHKQSPLPKGLGRQVRKLQYK
ncbi:MAG: thioesterase family protein [Cellvibrionales bacterium]|nr:thioesterase family protein [Cellvibrionales bacterium]